MNSLSTKKRRAVASASVVLTVIGFVGFGASPASALSQVELTQACRTQPNGTSYDYQAGWEAHLYGSTAYDWKCFYNNAPWAVWYNQRYNVDIERYCRNVYGNHAKLSNAGDPNSWYCG